MRRNLTSLPQGRSAGKTPVASGPMVRVVAPGMVSRQDYAGLVGLLREFLDTYGLYAFGLREEASKELAAKGRKGKWLGVAVSTGMPSPSGPVPMSTVLEAEAPTILITNDGEWRVRIGSIDRILDIFSSPWIPDLSEVLGSLPNSGVATGHLDEAHFYAVVAKSGLERYFDLSEKIWWGHAGDAVAKFRSSNPNDVGSVSKLTEVFRGKNLYRTEALEEVLRHAFRELAKFRLGRTGILLDFVIDAPTTGLMARTSVFFDGDLKDAATMLWEEILTMGLPSDFEDELHEAVRSCLNVGQVGRTISLDFQLELSETPGIIFEFPIPWPPTVPDFHEGVLLGSDARFEIGGWLSEADERSRWAAERLWVVVNLLSLSNDEIDARLGDIEEKIRDLLSSIDTVRLLGALTEIAERRGFLQKKNIG